MKESIRRWATLFCALLLAVGLVAPALADDGAQDVEQQTRRGAELVEIITPYVFDGDLRDLPTAPTWKPGDPIKEIPRRAIERPGAVPPGPQTIPAPRVDPLLALQEAASNAQSTRAFSPAELNFTGQGFTGVAPPDPSGAVGTQYYIQAINASGGAVFTVYDKSNGSVVSGPTFMDTLGSGFCGSGLGDPIVLYDGLADRWMLSEFSASGNRMCVYVSQTSNPLTGGWYAYDFAAPSFPDYPKYGIWPDAYYVGTNESQTALYAFDRNQMLAGGAAGMQRFTVPDLAGFNFQAMTPANLDGNAPPNGAPNYFMRHRDDEAHGGSTSNDFLEVYEFSVDWNNASNSSLTGPLNIAVSDFDSNLCGLLSFSCIDQPGSANLDPLREVVMFPLQYRNFGSYETLVGNLATDADGTDRAGVRWFELRKSGGGNWSLFQEGTYAPNDGNSRWMGSGGMDGAGNIAIGYNVAGSSTNPGLRYAGRLAGDPAGTLPQGEVTLVNGTGSSSTNRYGDYNHMSIDPVDDCTFWFTGEWNPSSSWSTRIGRFSFDNCGATCGNGVVEPGEVCDGADLNGGSCGSEGCSGGTLSCNSTCDGYDTSACSGCPSCDNDGLCEAGEDCNNCANDCASGSSSGAVNGNGVCEAGDGETCLNSNDCNGVQGGRPSNRYCCGDGSTGTGAVDCSDPRCGGAAECTNVPVPSGSYCCGDTTCDPGEDCATCALDCNNGPEQCSNGTDEDCDGDIDCADSDCATDPACVCTPTTENCSNGTDEDCDGDVDCDDADCSSDPACDTSCLPKNAVCSTDSECCSNNCKNNGRCR